MNRLKQLRHERHLSQEQLGAIVKVQKSAISKYELGRLSLSDDMIKKFCDFFGCSSDYLLGISEAPNRKTLRSEYTKERRLEDVEYQYQYYSDEEILRLSITPPHEKSGEFGLIQKSYIPIKLDIPLKGFNPSVLSSLKMYWFAKDILNLIIDYIDEFYEENSNSK